MTTHTEDMAAAKVVKDTEYTATRFSLYAAEFSKAEKVKFKLVSLVYKAVRKCEVYMSTAKLMVQILRLNYDAKYRQAFSKTVRSRQEILKDVNENIFQDRDKNIYVTSRQLEKMDVIYLGKMKKLGLSKAFAEKVRKLDCEAIKLCEDYQPYQQLGWIKPLFGDMR